MNPDLPSPANNMEIVPAASLIIFRRAPAGGQAQVLMVERSRQMRFAGGAAVFPGGRIEKSDYELADTLPHGLDRHEAASRIGALRETLEETGLVVGVADSVDGRQASVARQLVHEKGALAAALAKFNWSLDLGCLIPFARWLPRHHRQRGYDTRFYLADLGTGQVELQADGEESQHLFWVSATEAICLADQGRISIIFPTRRNLERIAQFEKFDDCERHARAIPVDVITPQIVTIAGRRWMTIPNNLGYPVTSALMPD